MLIAAAGVSLALPSDRGHGPYHPGRETLHHLRPLRRHPGPGWGRVQYLRGRRQQHQDKQRKTLRNAAVASPKGGTPSLACFATWLACRRSHTLQRCGAIILMMRCWDSCIVCFGGIPIGGPGALRKEPHPHGRHNSIPWTTWRGRSPIRDQNACALWSDYITSKVWARRGWWSLGLTTLYSSK